MQWHPLVFAPPSHLHRLYFSQWRQGVHVSKSGSCNFSRSHIFSVSCVTWRCLDWKIQRFSLISISLFILMNSITRFPFEALLENTFCASSMHLAEAKEKTWSWCQKHILLKGKVLFLASMNVPKRHEVNDHCENVNWMATNNLSKIVMIIMMHTLYHPVVWFGSNPIQLLLASCQRRIWNGSLYDAHVMLGESPRCLFATLLVQKI